jgi:biotin carboxylase
MARVLLLIPTTSYRAKDFLDAADAVGVVAVVGSDQPQVLAEAAPGTSLAVNFHDIDAGVATIAGFDGDYPLDAILPADEQAAVLAAAASAALNLGHSSTQAVEIAGNKHLLRQALAPATVNSPAFTVLSVDDDPSKATRFLTYPCVLKPLSLSGSRGVLRADGDNSFVEAFFRVKQIIADAGDRAGPDRDKILVEAYVPGIDVALEALLIDGDLHPLALFDKPDPLEGPTFEETIYVTPSRLVDATQAAVIAATAKAAKAIGLAQGPVHAELRINDDGVWVIEVAARSIGGLCGRTLKFGAGISLEEIILRQALGLPTDSLEREAQASGVMMIPIPSGGTLVSVGEQDAARDVPGIEDVRITLANGQPVVPLPEGDKYLGFIFARGEDPATVEAALRTAHAVLEINIDAEN